MATKKTIPKIEVTLLTGGGDRPYAFGLATELISKATILDLIGSDELDHPEFHDKPGVTYLNLRKTQQTGASLLQKIYRILMYYARLIRYASTARPKLFHILWNNKFALFDRTALMLYYRLLRKKIVLTVHNVNAGRRDSRDSRLNRLTLRIQYRLTHHIFVHTETMKLELVEEYGVRRELITVIPFGINNAVPNTYLTTAEAKQRLGIRTGDKTLLFFGNIKPYKGIEYLVTAFQQLLHEREDYLLIIAGRPDDRDEYWTALREEIDEGVREAKIILRADFIPDDETEIYFKAADLLVLPYRHIYQSGVLFLGYSFGLPVVAADVGCLKDEIVDGKTGRIFRPEDPADLARAIKEHFASELHVGLNSRRQEIRDYATERHSWDVVGRITTSVYASLLRTPSDERAMNRDASSASLDVNTRS